MFGWHHCVAAAAEIRTDHQMHVIKLAGNQPAVVTPLGQPVPRGVAYAGQVLGQTDHVVDLHLRGLPSFVWSYARRHDLACHGQLGWLVEPLPESARPGAP